MDPRSYLYVPGDRPDRFTKAVQSGADAVILDLEDAVAPADKGLARDAVATHLAAPPPDEAEQWVRINAGSRGVDDLRAVRGLPGLAGVVVPKATRRSLDELAGGADAVPLCALVESAAGVLDVLGIAAHERVVALAMGEVDLAAELAIVPSPDERTLWPIRMQVVVASAANGLRPPIGPVHTALRDLEGLRASTMQLRDGGFGARQAIHPSQVAVINEALSPTAEEIERAEQLLERAAASGAGVFVDGGEMIDEAVLRWARRVTTRARRLGEGDARVG